MKTDSLIALLAQDNTPLRPIAPRLLGWSGLAILTTATLALLALGIRSDLAAALANPVTLMKWLLPLAVALSAMRAALALTQPQIRAVAVQALVLVVAAVALLWLVAAGVGVAPGQLWPTMRGNTMLVCLSSITLISSLPLGIGLLVLREGASAAPMRSGALLGAAVGGFAAALYALHCNEDAPLFFLTWYGLGIAIVAAIGAMAGRSVLRW